MMISLKSSLVIYSSVFIRGQNSTFFRCFNLQNNICFCYSKMKRILHLIILLIIFCCFCCSNAFDKGRYRKCIENLRSDEINLYYFYENKFQFAINNKNDVVNSVGMEGFIGDAILTCVCRETYEPIFFISSYYLNYGEFEDVYFYCVLGNPKSVGIHDDYEIYDNLLFESIKNIPNTLMTPLKDDDSSEVGCFDKDGFLSKSIGNQKTCFFALEIKDSESFHESEIYSGPLISSELPNVWSNILKLNPSCYTSVKDTTFIRFDLCFYIPSDSVFLCCCPKETKNCRINPDEKKKLFCAPPEFANKNGEPILSYMERYLRENVNNACGIIIYPTQSSFISEGTNLPKFRIAYNSLNSCLNETTTVDFSKTRFCSSEAVKPENIQIQKCCQNGHFCNLNLTAFKRNDVKPYKCAYKPDISFHFDESTTCEWYYDLTLEKRVYLHENFTTKIIHKTLDGYMEIEGYGGKAVRYSCSYIFAQIINVDSKDCKQNYNEMGSIKPFYYCLCGEINCDAVTTLSPPKKGFECETVMRTDINLAMCLDFSKFSDRANFGLKR